MQLNLKIRHQIGGCLVSSYFQIIIIETISITCKLIFRIYYVKLSRVMGLKIFSSENLPTSYKVCNAVR